MFRFTTQGKRLHLLFVFEDVHVELFGVRLTVWKPDFEGFVMKQLLDSLGFLVSYKWLQDCFSCFLKHHHRDVFDFRINSQRRGLHEFAFLSGSHFLHFLSLRQVPLGRFLDKTVFVKISCVKKNLLNKNLLRFLYQNKSDLGDKF